MATGLKDWRGRQQRTYGERGTMREGRHSQPRVDIPLAKAARNGYLAEPRFGFLI